MHQEGTRYRATIQYDGSGFSGWQAQPGVRTVQGDLEAALARLGIYGRVAAAGRTDTGVHATAQEISFDSGRNWSPDDLARALDAVTPDGLWIESVRQAEPDFHPRFQATGRRYEYYVVPGRAGRSPLRRRSVWGVEPAPDWERLSSAAGLLVGEGDFGALSRAGQPELGTRCRIETAEWIHTPLGDLCFTIVADRFLHRMVRYLVSVQVEIGTGRRVEEELRDLLRAEENVRPPAPAPACGLYLTGVRYPEGWNRPPGVPGFWRPEDDEPRS